MLDTEKPNDVRVGSRVAVPDDVMRRLPPSNEEQKTERIGWD